ncbi:MAG: PQQ-binding-like beta-propeller repeat protein [Opitutaceae bacterium]|nr:PQQ-binding-like beta-propeller repeat protein [Opitutaceae bacterium]
MNFKFIVSISALLASQVAIATDWPRFLGPNGNGIVKNDPQLRLDWKTNPPKTAWTYQAGKGCSSFAISNGKVLTLGNQDGQDTLWCLDTLNGDLIWKHSYDEPLAAKYYTGGSSSTPTIDGKHVYSVSKSGKLFCLDLDSGNVLWQKDYVKDFNGRKGGWGWAASPVVSDDLLFIDPGAKDGALVALDKKTGDLKWKAGNDEPGYATPILYEHEGRKSLALFHKKGLVGYSLKRPGDTNFRFSWRTSYGANASNPHYHNGTFYISSGYGSGYAVIDIASDEPEIIHRDRKLILKVQTSLKIGNRIIAHYGGDGKPGDLVAMNIETGDILWEAKMPGDLGNLIAIGDNLINLADSGHIILGKDTGNQFQEISRHKILSGTSWAPPAYANGRLYIRNNQGEAICLNVSKE